MKKQVYLRLTLLSLFAALAVALTLPPAARADGPTHLDSTDVLGQIRGPACNVMMPMAGVITSMTPADTLVFNARGCGPVLAPDGHQLTLGEFKAVEGRATVKCINMGTHTVVHFSGLIPNGVYTVWLFIFANGNPPIPFTAFGALGNSSPADPIDNAFIASEAGQGQLVRTNAEGVLSANGGSVAGCWLGTYPEAHVALVYHINGLTNGPVPGPTNTWVAQEFFRFLP